MRLRVASAAIVLVAVAAIVHAWFVFSQTVDEPAHVAAGTEWLSGSYELDPQHPPLARIVTAIGPALRGAEYQIFPHWLFAGNAILYGNGDPQVTLASARAGTLLFFLLGCWVVFAWARKLYGDLAGGAALLFFALQSSVLAHAGLATTDMAAAATIVAALFAFACWLEQPTTARSVLLGLAVAAAVASKFSALPFLPAAMIAMAIVHWRVSQSPAKGRAPIRPGAILVAVLTAAAGVLAVYRFDGGAFFRGIAELTVHNREGHPSYLFGDVRREGWWFYFPVALWFKTTLPLLAAFAYGAFVLVRRRAASLLPVAAFAAILSVAMVSRISIGVRHVLPLYPLMAIVAAYGVLQLRRPVMIALLLAQVASFAIAHPDHLAYFNLTAGRDPSRILLDSNLDWGQDLLRLEDACARRKIQSLHLVYFGSADLRRHRLPPHTRLRPFVPVHGWVAISEMQLKDLGARRRPRGAYDWLLRYEPVERVGSSILLYRIP